jgi:hypothetical protein
MAFQNGPEIAAHAPLVRPEFFRKSHGAEHTQTLRHVLRSVKSVRRRPAHRQTWIEDEMGWICLGSTDFGLGGSPAH